MTGCFVTTIALATSPQDRAILRKRFNAAQSCYNALLGECLRRMRLMRESRAWRAATKMARGAARTTAFRELAKQFRFREYDLYPFIQEQRRCWIGDHLDAHTCQSLAARAFAACQRALFKGTAVRFKRRGEMRSVEGRSAKSPLRWDADERTSIWNGLRLIAIIDPADVVIAHGLRHRARFARIVRMVIRGREQYYAQLVQEGEPLRKPQQTAGKGIVGLDLGPSTIAIVGEQSAELLTFCSELDDRHRELRRSQRQADRQVRANNPHCFDERGRWKKGQRIKVRSRRMRRVRAAIAEAARREAAHRCNLHGRLVNHVLSLGDDVRLEKLSYKAWQRLFGRSVKFRGPGTFVARLRAAAKKAEASVTEFDPRNPKCSQTCPNCGRVLKKKLSQRWHACPCGCEGQRDLISALLCHAVQEDRLDAPAAHGAWQRLCHVVHAASSVGNGATGGASAHAHPAAEQGRAPSHENARHIQDRNPDVVAGRKAQARAGCNPGEEGPQSPMGSPIASGRSYRLIEKPAPDRRSTQALASGKEMVTALGTLRVSRNP